jgi:hypothetical protein
MRWQIVHNDDIPRLQKRGEHLLAPISEGVAVHSVIEQHGCAELAAGQCANKGCGHPVAMWD